MYYPWSTCIKLFCPINSQTDNQSQHHSHSCCLLSLSQHHTALVLSCALLCLSITLFLLSHVPCFVSASCCSCSLVCVPCFVSASHCHVPCFVSASCSSCALPCPSMPSMALALPRPSIIGIYDRAKLLSCTLSNKLELINGSEILNCPMN